ncbi:MAG TPA: GTPase, partial [Calditrichia bacterium]|nr:GTPase [Calditrichia bacterium]
MSGQTPQRVLILGAAGRDFHDFNAYFRGNPAYRVVGFTATQIPNISDRRYPAALAGGFYPEGIPIYPEDEMESLILEKEIDEVV